MSSRKRKLPCATGSSRPYGRRSHPTAQADQAAVLGVLALPPFQQAQTILSYAPSAGNSTQTC